MASGERLGTESSPKLLPRRFRRVPEGDAGASETVPRFGGDGRRLGSAMTKNELVEVVVGRTPHLSKKDIEFVVDTIFESMAQALQRGERIDIRGFGSFQVKVRRAREGHNPKTGELIHVPTRRRPFFRVAKELKERVGGVALTSPRAPAAHSESRRCRR